MIAFLFTAPPNCISSEHRYIYAAAISLIKLFITELIALFKIFIYSLSFTFLSIKILNLAIIISSKQAYEETVIAPNL